MPAPTTTRRKPASIMDRQKNKNNAKGQQPKKKQPVCCSEPKPEDDGEGRLVCQNCFTQISESNIVGEVQFGEDSRGAATLQGGFIGDGQRHAGTGGAGMSRLGGGTERNSAQISTANAKRTLAQLGAKLVIHAKYTDQAVQLFLLASQANFSAGRRTDEVVAACLYACCRRDTNNTVMLIDISELLQINVFRLGEVYKALCKDLFLDLGNGAASVYKAVGMQHRTEVESLIMKYCKNLYFGDDTRRIAADAVKIMRRMKRDWMVTGRHPAGLCGACIIYAARMNNYKRTKREVVYVAKIADQTIAKRMEEFRRTRAAAMTVDDFRAKGQLLKTNHLPPAMAESALKEAKFEEKKRRRQEDNAAAETANGTVTEVITINDGESDAGTPAPENDGDQAGPSKRRKTSDEASVATQQEPRFDEDGFAVPGVPASMTKTGDQGDRPPTEKKRRGRKKKEPMAPITQEELMLEDELEREIGDLLKDEEISDKLHDAQVQHDQEMAAEREKARLKKLKEAQSGGKEGQSNGRSITWEDDRPRPTEIVTDEELEAEFANDREVMNCLLQDSEQRLKEQLWVTENEDWLRQQAHKELIAVVDKETGVESRGKRGAKGKRGRKSKMGDNSSLTEANTPIENAADATEAMLRKRAPKAFSQHINYDAIKKAYRHTSSSASTSRAGSVTPSVADSEASRDSASPAPNGRGLQTPAPTQQQQATTGSPTGGEPGDVDAQAPMTPPVTQIPGNNDDADEGDDDDDEEDNPNDYIDDEGNPDDYAVDDELDYGYNEDGGGWLGGDDDDREDIGEDEWTNPLSRSAMGQFGDASLDDEGFL